MPKKQLLRIVRTPEEQLVYDQTGKRSGRGAYICMKNSCLDLALKKGSISRALECPVDEALIGDLRHAILIQGDKNESAK